ncbi:MAG: alpha/beta hydrolase [Alphaproteobacteria bacterium]|nr:alpha/beta hydrolase [Alphaproteobacteria bacterium]
MAMMRIKGIDLELERIACDRVAPAPTLVFLHEGLGSLALWGSKEGPWPQALCRELNCPGLVYSRQGYGQSAPIADVRGAGRHGPDFMHRQALDVLPALLQAMGIQQPILVGHSDGGTIALLHAAQHRVQACVVMAPHVIVEPISLAAIEQARQAFESGGLRARLARFHGDVDTAFWQWCDVWLSPQFRDFDIRGECRGIVDPVLAIQGIDDAYGTLAQIEDIHPSGVIERLVLPDCGHSPHRDQPAAVTLAISRFLRQHVPALAG